VDCACERCQNFCRVKPGWFAPDQLAPLARRLGLTIEELFRRYLTIDAVLVSEGSATVALYALAPAMVGRSAGAISDPAEKGACVWLEGGRCAIHELKPRECSLVDHSTTPEASNLMRAAILREWRQRRKFVQDLYGKKLKPPSALKAAMRQARRPKRPSN
jgi:Fe-S-cluster containining protein